MCENYEAAARAEQEDIMCASSAPRYGAGRWHRKRKELQCLCVQNFSAAARSKKILCAPLRRPAMAPAAGIENARTLPLLSIPIPALRSVSNPASARIFFFKNFLLACGRPNLEWLKLKETSAPPATPILGRPRSGLAQPRRKTHTVAQGIFSPLFFKIYFILYFIYIKKIKNKIFLKKINFSNFKIAARWRARSARLYSLLINKNNIRKINEKTFRLDSLFHFLPRGPEG